eukprot:365611-Chlamydomonas_euryale.AAC.21
MPLCAPRGRQLVLNCLVRQADVRLRPWIMRAAGGDEQGWHAQGEGSRGEARGATSGRQYCRMLQHRATL